MISIHMPYCAESLLGHEGFCPHTPTTSPHWLAQVKEQLQDWAADERSIQTALDATTGKRPREILADMISEIHTKRNILHADALARGYTDKELGL